MTASTLTPISPAEVHGILARHILADGYDIVFGFEKSRGAWVHDSRAARPSTWPRPRRTRHWRSCARA